MDVLLKDPNSPIVMLEGYSGAESTWYASPSHSELHILTFSPRYKNRIKQLQGKETAQMKELKRFQGSIGSPVNHDNVHWGLLVLDKTGEAYYYDSMVGKVDERIRLIAKCVHLLLFAFGLLPD